MLSRRKAREAWHDRELLATAAFTWPVHEWQAPERVDPARDPQYPHNRAWERGELERVDANSPHTVAYWATREDDFDPESNDRFLWLRGVPGMSGEGAIYTPEYLERETKREVKEACICMGGPSTGGDENEHAQDCPARRGGGGHA